MPALVGVLSGGSGKWCDPYLADSPVVASQSVLGLVRNRSCCLLVGRCPNFRKVVYSGEWATHHIRVPLGRGYGLYLSIGLLAVGTPAGTKGVTLVKSVPGTCPG